MRQGGRTQPRLPLLQRFARKRGTQARERDLLRRIRELEMARREGGQVTLVRVQGGGGGGGALGDHNHTLAGDGGKLSGAIVDTEIILEDVDGTPVGDILLKVIDQWLRVRDAGDVGYAGIEVLEAVLGGPIANGILLKTALGNLFVRRGDDSTYGNILASLFSADALDTLPGNDRLSMGNQANLRRLFIPTSVGDPGAVADGDMWYEQITSKFRAREGGVSVDMIGGGVGGGVDPIALWFIDGVMGV